MVTKLRTKKKNAVIPKIIGLVFLILFIYPFISTGLFSYFLIKNYGICTKALVLEETNGGRYSSNTYKFQFSIKGKIIKGNLAKNEDYKPGDSVCVIYCSFYPEENRSCNFYNKVHCDCH
jgi:hypothetical protein